jgi:hypothetical protein
MVLMGTFALKMDASASSGRGERRWHLGYELQFKDGFKADSGADSGVAGGLD